MCRAVGLAALAASASGCGLLDVRPASPAPSVAAGWQAPLPAEAAARGAGLQRWWAQFDDPLLLQAIDAAQLASPGISAAANRIAQARALRVAASAALLPQAGASASALRGRSDPSLPVANTSSAGLQASWEIDLFGAAARARDAADARLQGAQAAWHDARTAVAAEAASGVVELRACEAQLALTAVDVESRAETARLTGLLSDAGFRAPADAALARASAAQGRILQTQQRTQCELLVKSLVALTALDEADLRQRLAAGTGRLPQAGPVAVTVLPAALLQQRPDLSVAARNVAAASADEAERAARRWPQVSLSGAVGAARLSTANASFSGSTWSLGPLSVQLPLFDGGRRAADVVAARAAYDDAVAQYQAAVRTAVREVEEALVRLQGTASRQDDATTAADGFEASLRATDARWRGGVATLFDLEDARRSAVQARSALIELQRERLAAWIGLYRALGGGFDAAELSAASGTAGTPPSVSRTD